jgi:D-amino-acid dehydrogenase
VDEILVVGAGIIGLCSAYHLVKAGVKVTVVDSDPEGDKVSLGNAGGIAVTEVLPASASGLLWRVPGWLMDPLGPLSIRPGHAVKLVPWLWRFARSARPAEVARISAALAALNARVYDDLTPLLAETGLLGELHRNGALTVYASEAGFRRDAGDWARRRSHGIDAIALSGDEARRLEPALGPIVRRAVLAPQWAQVEDPKSVLDGLRRWMQQLGVPVVTGRVVDARDSDDGELSVRLEGGRVLPTGKLVVAAGAWSGLLARVFGDRVLVESERGYNTTIRRPGISIHGELIFAEHKIVATHLQCGLRIGGAAEFGGLTSPHNYSRCRALMAVASKYLPGLKAAGGTDWVGHRSATPDSLPVIGPSRRNRKIFYAFGHGHLGLTHAATTGRLVAELATGKPTVIDVTPYSIDRFS